jgi:hypothetical protein
LAGRSSIASLVGNLFFPLDCTLELRRSRRSPEVLKRVVALGGNAHSYKEASHTLQRQTEIKLTIKETQTLTEQVGAEWAAVRDEQVEQFKQGTLQRLHAQAPEAAAVMIDGAYIQMRAAEESQGVHGQGWKEFKCASLATLSSPVSAIDPMPEPPSKFLNPERVKRLVTEVAERHGALHAAPKPQAATKPKPKRKKPRTCLTRRVVRLVTTFVASLRTAEEFGSMAATETFLRSLDLAQRKGFICDGLPYNWTIYETHFRPLGFIPILDFLHLLTHLYTAAQALEASPWRAWPRYEQWLRWAWGGERAALLKALQRASGKAGLPPPNAKEHDRRAVLARTATYVANNYDRIDYPRYRKLGLPYSSAPVESAVKQFCRRVKGSEKFWIAPGAEGALQVRAAYLSQDNRVERLWARPVRAHAYGTNWRDIAA